MASTERRHEGAARLSGEEARQGQVVLTSRRRRVIFIAGLVGIVLLPLILAVFW